MPALRITIIHLDSHDAHDSHNAISDILFSRNSQKPHKSGILHRVRLRQGSRSLGNHLSARMRNDRSLRAILTHPVNLYDILKNERPNPNLKAICVLLSSAWVPRLKRSCHRLGQGLVQPGYTFSKGPKRPYNPKPTDSRLSEHPPPPPEEHLQGLCDQLLLHGVGCEGSRHLAQHLTFQKQLAQRDVGGRGGLGM